MKGSYDIRIANRSLSYHFRINRNITIIQGDSATGKTTMVDMIREYELQGEDSAVSIQCRCACNVVEGNTWQKQLSAIENSIVFIDEGNRFVSSREFADTIAHSSNYYVIVTREPLYNLPYSVEEIYGIHSTGKYGTLTPVYHEMYRIYSSEAISGEINVREHKTFLVEDSNAGFQFFQGCCKAEVACVSAGGNSNICRLLEGQLSQETVLVIADGAAFGPFMSRIGVLMKRHPDISLYLPESFEWLILTSGLIDGNRIKKIAENPSDYIDSMQYFSWEQYFTALLIQETKDTWLHYQKSKLNEIYLHRRQAEAIISQMPPEIEALLEIHQSE